MYIDLPPSIFSVHGCTMTAKGCSFKLGRENTSVRVSIAGLSGSRQTGHDHGASEEIKPRSLSIEVKDQICAERDTAATVRTV
jgi:hypothetical protein